MLCLVYLCNVASSARFASFFASRASATGCFKALTAPLRWRNSSHSAPATKETQPKSDITNEQKQSWSVFDKYLLLSGLLPPSSNSSSSSSPLPSWI
ncbi:uncharacterized protein ASCRUDRAFT_75703 [Ascoidea rubescens DSM 1968]|uniref:Uncharacterized protein n=1 Tax=Ascoidea rubescens DSM 1968 TaxID=1344418 RepID=A0A1D2VH36_9ASCO|nr:hypothetical protein ASCRUDRAFT_75703 [Ascoidea rubescens DSM 1968]ODV60946.1 hypothetical protein ASCRUDRAFT_75703 [Ascoidea rubescens DSM 1968]